MYKPYYKINAMLISLVALPFLVGGVFTGFIVSNSLEKLGLYGSGVEAIMTRAFASLLLTALFGYLGALIAYAVFLWITTTFFYREQLKDMPPTFSVWKIKDFFLLTPFHMLERYMWGRKR